MLACDRHIPLIWAGLSSFTLLKRCRRPGASVRACGHPRELRATPTASRKARGPGLQKDDLRLSSRLLSPDRRSAIAKGSWHQFPPAAGPQAGCWHAGMGTRCDPAMPGLSAPPTLETMPPPDAAIVIKPRSGTQVVARAAGRRSRSRAKLRVHPVARRIGTHRQCERELPRQCTVGGDRGTPRPASADAAAPGPERRAARTRSWISRVGMARMISRLETEQRTAGLFRASSRPLPCQHRQERPRRSAPAIRRERRLLRVKA